VLDYLRPSQVSRIRIPIGVAERPSLPEQVHLGDTPLAHLGESELRPSREALAKVMADLG